jgi:hypothetical protein
MRYLLGHHVSRTVMQHKARFGRTKLIDVLKLADFEHSAATNDAVTTACVQQRRWRWRFPG